MGLSKRSPIIEPRDAVQTGPDTASSDDLRRFHDGRGTVWGAKVGVSAIVAWSSGEARFAQIVGSVLASPGKSAEQLESSVGRFEELVKAAERPVGLTDPAPSYPVSRTRNQR